MERGRKKLSCLLTVLLGLLLVCLPVRAAALETETAAEDAVQTGEQAQEPTPAETLPDGVEPEYTVVYGQQEEWDLLRTAFHCDKRPEGELTFSVAEPEEEYTEPVLEIDAQTGVFRPLRAGVAQVQAVERKEDTLISYTVQVTVEKGEQILSGWTDNELDYETGKTLDWGALLSHTGDGQLTYVSGDPEVATVDDRGVISLVCAGETEITVTAVETDCYREASLSARLTVTKGVQVLTGRKTSYTVQYAGTTYDWSSITSSGDGALTYRSSNPKVATVDPETGLITQTGVGTATITVTAAETERFREGVFVSTITINKGKQTFTGRKTSYTVRYADITYDWSNLKASGGGALTFVSSNPKVATVDARTGLITQTGVGTTVITVTAPETELYERTTFRSTIEIVKGTQKIEGIKSYYCVPRQSGKTYDWGKMLRLVRGDGKVTYASSNSKVATVDAKTGLITQKGYGTTVITITVSGTQRYEKLVFRSKIVIKARQTLSGLKTSYTVNYSDGKSYDWGSKIKCSGDGALTYASSNTKVATVSKNGVVTLKGVGTVTITIQAAESDKYAPTVFRSTIKVNKGTQTLTGIKTIYREAYQQGRTYDWSKKLSHTGDGAVTYSSSNPDVISVDAKTGLLTQQGKGLAVITVQAGATARYKAATFTSKVYVGQEAPVLGGIKSEYQVLCRVGKTYSWGEKLTNTGNGTPTFTSSNSKVVSVDRETGLLRIEGTGTATITITTAETPEYRSAKLTSKVVVYQNVANYAFSDAYKGGPYYPKLVALKLDGGNRANLLAVAKSQVGYTEGNNTSALGGTSGGSGNYTEYGRWYYRYVDSGDVFYKGAWCSMFVSWCANEAGISRSVVPPRALVAYMKNAFVDQGRYYTWSQSKCGGGGKAIQPGDFIFYSTSSSGRYSHIGIVTSVVYSGSRVTISTVEGNMENQCCTQRWSLSTGSGGRIRSNYYIRGFACPNYGS